MKKLMTFMLTLLMCTVMIMVFSPQTVRAAKQEGDIAGGVYDNVDWRITSEGELIIGNGGEQTFTNRSSRLYYSWPWYRYQAQIKTGRFDGKVYGNGNMFSMFSYCSKLTSLDVSGFDTSKVTSMNNMFYKCSSITSIDLSGFDTSNVTGMSSMFSYCSKLTSLDVSGFDTSNVTNMSQMFYSCSSLTSLDVSGFDTSKVTNMFSMFSNCPSLTSLDLSGFDTSSVTDMSSMFNNCASLTSLDVSGFDTSKVTNMFSMFSYCSKLTSLDVSGFDTSNVTNMSQMFYSCSSLTSLDVSGFDTSKVTSMSSMFYKCSSIASLDLSGFDTSNVTNMTDMFSNCRNLKSVNIGALFNFKGKNIPSSYNQAILPTPLADITTGKWIRNDGAEGPYTPAELRENYTSEMAGTWVPELKPCAVFTEDGTLSFIRPTADSTYTSGSTGIVKSISGGEYTGTIFTVDENSTGNTQSWSSIKTQVKKVQFVDEIRPKSTYKWFDGFGTCIEMDLKKLNTSDVVTMYEMFEDCTHLTDIDVSGFDTKNVTNMNSMFYHCYVVKNLDLSMFDTKKVTDMGSMFNGCGELEQVKLGENFSFTGNNISVDTWKSFLPTPSNVYSSPYTGKWIRDDKSFGPFTPTELRDNYTSEMAGIWILELKPTEYTLSFEAGENGTGSMAPVNAPAKEDFTLPANQFVAFGYDFDHWDDGNGKTYADKATIPANTYDADTTVTLTAVFKKRDTSVQMKDGSFTFDIKAGEKATFNDIPAGTSYQVYELTPDGWVLVQQENASGVIEALEESAAAFWNQYQPGVTTVQFSGLKTLDGHPAKEGTYKFELLENGKVIDTATTQDGGFIQFKVIEYDAAGDHTYTIREVEPDDDSVDYDTHEETVTVSVTDDGKGNLSSEVTYDEDGIKFENHTRPGILRITKNADVTEANKDDKFTFEITFSNENGMPISDNIYWYVEDQN